MLMKWLKNKDTTTRNQSPASVRYIFLILEDFLILKQKFYKQYPLFNGISEELAEWLLKPSGTNNQPTEVSTQ